MAIYGSTVGTVRLRVLRLGLSGFDNDGIADVGLIGVRCAKYSTAADGGADQTLTQVAIDSRHGLPTASLCAVLSGGTVPTLAGNLGARRALSRSADLVSALTQAPSIEFDFSEHGGVLLRSTRQGIGLNLESSELLFSGAVNCSAWIEWVEDF